MDISIVLSGEAGQGIQTLENLLARLVKSAGLHVFATKEYMSRVRGGVNSTSFRIADQPVAAPLRRIDWLIELSPGRTKHLSARLSTATQIVSDLNNNVAAAGYVHGLLGLELGSGEAIIRQYFAAKGEPLIAANLAAFKAGFEKYQPAGKPKRLVADALVAERLLLNGGEAIALGALAGGCNFVAAYPMTPSTGILTFLAQQANEFELVVEQAEDEISAVNMALGAWYAGARAMVTTSGGGFDLMQEGVSLAGMLETPLVISLGQRPGPATGLPTRTGQEDLNLALYSGHGEFPRVILAPGNIAEAFALSRRAFALADQYQIPVFILSDQYLVDSCYDQPQFDLRPTSNQSYFVQTTVDYQRYKLSEDGLSPRGLPGYGPGLVGVDSDEHDEAAHITEELALRKLMMEKRLKKLAPLVDIEPELIGAADYETLIVSWGSTKEIIKEALVVSGRAKVAMLHFQQVFPLPKSSHKYLAAAKKIISIENNYSGQFAELIQRKLGVMIPDRIVKYDGLPFTVEELVERLNG